MPMRFNANQPTDKESILRYASGGGFSTPEAVASDSFFNAPQGRDYLIGEYQRLTGDAFADPFEDASKQRSKALIAAALQGDSVATGSNMGGNILAIPRISTATPMSPAGVAPSAQPSVRSISETEAGTTAAARSPVATVQRADDWQPTATNWADREIQREQLRTLMMERIPAKDRINAPEMLLPAAAPKTGVQFQKVYRQIEQRMNLAGAGALFRKIDPIYFSYGTSADDPRFARLQGGREGKIEASDALHPIANHPEFKREAARNPELAKNAYYAATNGRDYATDVAANAQLIAEQKDEQKRIRQTVKGAQFDRATGKWTKEVEHWDDSGNYVSQRVPLNTVEAAAFTTAGVERDTGLKMPNQLKPYGDTPERQAAHRQLAQQIADEKKIPIEEAWVVAQNRLFSAQATRDPNYQRPTATTTGEGGPLDALMYLKPSDATVPFHFLGKHAVNTAIAAHNIQPRIANAIAAMRGKTTRTPLTPLVTEPNFPAESPRDLENRDAAVQLLRKLFTAGVAGATGHTAPPVTNAPSLEQLLQALISPDTSTTRRLQSARPRPVRPTAYEGDATYAPFKNDPSVLPTPPYEGDLLPSMY